MTTNNHPNWTLLSPALCSPGRGLGGSKGPTRRAGIGLGLFVIVAVLGLSGLGGCEGGSPEDNCLAESTEVAPTGARHVLDVPLPFEPGPMVVLSQAEEGARISKSSRLWLGEGGTQLYALQGAEVWGLDLGTLELTRVASVDRQAEQLAGLDRHDTLLVTDSARGVLWVLDQVRPASPVLIPVGTAPAAVALGPGCRLAYVANAGDHSLSLVDTGVGTISQTHREVLVAAKSAGSLVRLDGDGRPRARYDGLPSRLEDLTLVASGRLAVASYSEIHVTGNIGVIGDGVIVLEEGLVTVDLESGAVQRFPLPRAVDGPRAGVLARPKGLLDLGQQRVVVALPGWSTLAVVDLDAGSPTWGQVLREIPVPGRPSWLTQASLDLDWIYVLDDESGSLTVVSPKGQVTRQIPLR